MMTESLKKKLAFLGYEMRKKKIAKDWDKVIGTPKMAASPTDSPYWIFELLGWNKHEKRTNRNK